MKVKVKQTIVSFWCVYGRIGWGHTTGGESGKGINSSEIILSQAQLASL